MKRLLSLCVAVVATIGMWAGNVITYTATAKLTETTSTYSYGLHTNAFGSGVSISSHTFSDGTGTITFDKEIGTIGERAFYTCDQMTSVTIPNSVTSIGSNAFSSCSKLTSITIPDGVTSIGASAFSSCSKLARVDIGDIAAWCAISFANNESNPLYYNGAHLYLNGSEVTNLTIPNVVTSIGNYAFAGCRGLSIIVIPNSVTSIGDYAFYICSDLTTFDGGNNITSIGRRAFQGCTSMDYFTIPNGLTSIEENTFYNCRSLPSITIPSGVTSIGYGAFSNCSSLLSVTIPNNVISIGGSAFSYCTDLSSVSIGNSVTSIGNGAFSGCSDLSSITIPNSVTSIGMQAFNGCSNLASITIGNHVTSIGMQAFNGCSSLTMVDISDIAAWCAIDFISGANPLYYANHLYLNGIEITSLIIPIGVTTISDCAFYGCSGLTSVIFPKSISNIGSSAFSGCNGLTSITCKAAIPPTIGSSYTFENLQNVPIYVPCESIDDYQSASYWSNFNSIQGYDCDPYTRSTTTGKYGTICLPTAVSTEDITGGVFFNIVYAVTNTSNEVTGILMEEETGDLVAGKAYVFRATANELVLACTGSSVENPIATTGLVGNLDEDPIDVPQGMYVLSNNQIRKLNGGSATIGQNRAYIDLTNVTKLNYVPAAAPGRIMLYVEDNNPVVTDVRDDNVEKKPVKILRDGMLFIIRDGKTYDMLGNTH